MTVLEVGAVISGRYRLEARLGAGATAAVWRARDVDLGRVVALKLLLESGVEPELANRFEREGTILARLDHPNLVRVLAAGTDEGRPYLVMELVDGVALDARLDGPMPVDEAVALVADVAAGLAAAHRSGVVHRDVKPANIVCGHDGSPRLVDFGIARVSDLTAMTRANAVLGTATYLSPEQARGEVPGPASDVYALGCVFYLLLTGRPPFQGDSPVAVAYQQVHDEPVPPSTLRPDVPPWVEAVVLRCLAKAPADRYPTAAELETALRPDPGATALLTPTSGDTMLLPAVEATAAAALPPSVPSSRWGVLVLAGVGAFLAAFLLVGYLGRDSGNAHPPTTTTTTTTTIATTTTTIAPPVTKPPKGKGHGKKDEG